MRIPVIVGGGLVVLAAGALLVATHHGGAGAVAGSRSEIRDDHRFVNGPTAGATFASVSQRLMADGNTCTRRFGTSDPRCTARLSAAAYASVVAAMLVNCTQPGVYEARHHLDGELGEIAAYAGPGSGPPPTVPPLPSC